jgi:hypothetical protein
MSDTASKNLSGFGDKTDSNGNEFLAFTLGKEEYGIDILKVQEIRGYEAVTRIANSPDFIKGVSTCAASSSPSSTCASSSSWASRPMTSSPW